MAALRLLAVTAHPDDGLPPVAGAGYAALRTLTDAHHEALWGTQSFYRAFSLVNGGRGREHDLFEGLDAPRAVERSEPRLA